MINFIPQRRKNSRPVIPKVCSADHWWYARLAEVVRESLFKSIFCALRTTKIFLVVRAPEKFGNHCSRHSFLNKSIKLISYNSPWRSLEVVNAFRCRTSRCFSSSLEFYGIIFFECKQI